MMQSGSSKAIKLWQPNTVSGLCCIVSYVLDCLPSISYQTCLATRLGQATNSSNFCAHEFLCINLHRGMESCSNSGMNSSGNGLYNSQKLMLSRHKANQLFEW